MITFLALLYFPSCSKTPPDSSSLRRAVVSYWIIQRSWPSVSGTRTHDREGAGHITLLDVSPASETTTRLWASKARVASWEALLSHWNATHTDLPSQNSAYLLSIFMAHILSLFSTPSFLLEKVTGDETVVLTERKLAECIRTLSEHWLKLWIVYHWGEG